MINSEDSADVLKQTETGAVCSGNGGGYPRSIRRRGFYRALRRGEAWAVYEDAHNKWLKEATRKLIEAVYNPSPFFGLLDRSNEPLPVISGLEAWLPKEDIPG